MDQTEFTIKFDWRGSELSRNLDQMGPKVKALLRMYANTKAPQLTSYMQTHRPWTDRTGMAKATLNTTVSEPSENVIRFTLAHGVDYGIWLELAHGKNYAIVAPTINQEGPKVFQEVGNLFSKLKF